MKAQNILDVWVGGGKTVLCRTDDSVTLRFVGGGLYNIKPVIQEYFTASGAADKIKPINYQFNEEGRESPFIFLPTKAGTYTFAIFSSPPPDLIKTKIPVPRLYSQSIQIVVRESDDYVGFLTELLGLPFILPPRHLPNYGHQTDLRMGTDCAEMAIYGKRRQGFKMPYCGPRNIYKYLRPSSTIRSGTVIHFGFQVSVVYKDLGKQGVLDESDLLIHAINDAVKIQRFGESELWGKKFTTFEWNDSILTHSK